MVAASGNCNVSVHTVTSPRAALGVPHPTALVTGYAPVLSVIFNDVCPLSGVIVKDSCIMCLWVLKLLKIFLYFRQYKALQIYAPSSLRGVNFPFPPSCS